MTNETMLKKLIERALDSGWENPWGETTQSTIFFDPSFLKALFGEEGVPLKFPQGRLENTKVVENVYVGMRPKWSVKATQLAIMEPGERLKYIYDEVMG